MNDFRTNRTDHRLGHASMQQYDDSGEAAPAAAPKKVTPAKTTTSNQRGITNAIAATHRPAHGGFPGVGGRYSS